MANLPPLYLFGSLTQDLLPSGRPENTQLIHVNSVDEIPFGQNTCLLLGEDAEVFFQQAKRSLVSAILLAVGLRDQKTLDVQWGSRDEYTATIQLPTKDEHGPGFWADVLELDEPYE